MNFELGSNICSIVSRSGKKEPNIPVYVALREDRKLVKNMVDEIELNDEDEVMQHMPYLNLKKGITRQILYISGASGSGKSFYTSMYLKQYSRMFPKNPIYLFSSLAKDDIIDKCKNVVRIDFKDKSFYEATYTIENFKDSLILYDDTEMISSKFISTKLRDLQDLILTTGRHSGTFFIITSHKCNDRDKTKLVLSESNSITLFTDTMGAKQLDYALTSGFGFNSKEIDIIRRLDTRWITVLRTAPVTVMHEKGIFTLSRK